MTFRQPARMHQEPGIADLRDVEIGHRSSAVRHPGNIAARLGRPLKWDPVKERILDDGEAASMLSRPYCSPLKLRVS